MDRVTHILQHFNSSSDASLPDFSANTEDYESEIFCIKYLTQMINKKLNILTICGGADTSVSLLSHHWQNEYINKLDIVDIKATQIYLLDFKLKCCLFCENENDIKSVMFYTNINNVEIYINNIRDNLFNNACKMYWDKHINSIQNGVMNCSKWSNVCNSFWNGVTNKNVDVQKRKIMLLNQNTDNTFRFYLESMITCYQNYLKYKPHKMNNNYIFDAAILGIIRHENIQKYEMPLWIKNRINQTNQKMIITRKNDLSSVHYYVGDIFNGVLSLQSNKQYHFMTLSGIFNMNDNINKLQLQIKKISLHLCPNGLLLIRYIWGKQKCIQLFELNQFIYLQKVSMHIEHNIEKSPFHVLVFQKTL